MDSTKFRNLVQEVSNKTISTEQATHFLSIFNDELNEAINAASREFVKKHFGSRNK